MNLDALSLSSNNSNEILNDINEPHQSSPGSSSGSASAYVPDLLDNVDNYVITTEINDSGEFDSIDGIGKTCAL